jgi:hypothetical protein
MLTLKLEGKGKLYSIDFFRSTMMLTNLQSVYFGNLNMYPNDDEVPRNSTPLQDHEMIGMAIVANTNDQVTIVSVLMLCFFEMKH